jgi:hypothetical protein
MSDLAGAGAIKRLAEVGFASRLTEEARTVDARASSTLPRGEMMMAGKTITSA